MQLATSMSFVWSAWTLAFTALCIMAGRRILSTLHRHWSLSHLPGPPIPSLLVGNELEAKQARAGTKWNIWLNRYGSTFRFAGPFMEPVLVTSDPKAITHILTTNVDNYARPTSDRLLLRLWLGPGLLSAEGQEHRRMRKMLNKAFTSQSIGMVSQALFDVAAEIRESWLNSLKESSSKIIDIPQYTSSYALDAIGKTMLTSESLTENEQLRSSLQVFSGSEVADATQIIMQGLVSLFPFLMKLPNPINRSSKSLRAELAVITERLLEEDNANTKVLDLLGRNTGDRQDIISKEEATAQLATLLVAGSETVSNVIGELLLELAMQPEIQEKLRTEFQTFDHQFGRPPTYEEIMRPSVLPYLELVTREAIRCKSPFTTIGRCALHDDIITLKNPLPTGEIKIAIKAGQEIAIPTRDGINTDPTIWGPSAGDFRPERWANDGASLPESVTQVHTLGHVLTWGDGPRVCLGRIFAIAEIKIIIYTLVSSFLLEDSGKKVDFYELSVGQVKAKVRGDEDAGVQLPIKISLARPYALHSQE